MTGENEKGKKSPQNSAQVKYNIGTSTSSNEEFDLERFRLSNLHKTACTDQKGLCTKNSQVEENYNNISILGIKFLIKYLVERNKDPILFLKTVFILYMCGDIVYIIVCIMGSRFDPILSSMVMISQIIILLFVIIVLKKSIVKGVQYNIQEYPILIVNVLAFAGANFYSFLVSTPFNSLPLFLLGLFFIVTFYMVMNAFVTLPNNVDASDPNYQLKFFIKRSVFGVINSVGTIDVMSDIALGIEIIRNYKGYLMMLGIVLFVCCLVDFFIVNVRFLAPDKVTVKMHVWAIVVEIIIVVVSVLVAIKLDKKDTDWDFVLLLIFSFVSTFVNFLHHIFMIVEWKLQAKRANKDIKLVEVFE